MTGSPLPRSWPGWAAGPAVPRQPAVRRRDHPVPGRRGLAAVGRLRPVAGDRADRGDPGPARAEAARDRAGPGTGRGPGRRDHDDRAARPAHRDAHRTAAARRDYLRHQHLRPARARAHGPAGSSLRNDGPRRKRRQHGPGQAEGLPGPGRRRPVGHRGAVPRRPRGMAPDLPAQRGQAPAGRPLPDRPQPDHPRLGAADPAARRRCMPPPRTQAAPGPQRPAAAGPRSRPPSPPRQPHRHPGRPGQRSRLHSPPGQPGRPHGHPRRPRARGRPPAAARRAGARICPRSRCGCRPAR